MTNGQTGSRREKRRGWERRRERKREEGEGEAGIKERGKKEEYRSGYRLLSQTPSIHLLGSPTAGAEGSGVAVEQAGYSSLDR